MPGCISRLMIKSFLPMTYLLILLIALIFIRFILPGLVRALLARFIRKQIRTHGFEMPSQAPPQPHSASATGQVRVEFVPPRKTINPNKPHSASGGEYVDFEEIK
jgi:hypothetical protein